MVCHINAIKMTSSGRVCITTQHLVLQKFDSVQPFFEYFLGSRRFGGLISLGNGIQNRRFR